MSRAESGGADREPTPLRGARPALSVTLRRRLTTFMLDVGFDSDAGVTALLGPSGAGKTLTLRAIAGLLRPDAGRITAGGRVLFDAAAGVDLPARARRVGYVFQQYALFPHLTVAENVAYGLHGWPRAAREARVAEVLEIVGLIGYGGRWPRALSGGQQQRVALARALAVEPDVLLADEPTAELDAGARERVLQVVADRAAAGTVVVVATHDPEVAAACGQQLRLVQGRVAAA